MDYAPLESILIVFQKPAEGRQASYDDWYTNIHIRDAMRLDGAIATQRFIVADDQPVLGGRKVVPRHWAHTIYEWESAEKSVDGHSARAGTPLMEISRDGVFDELRDFFFRPVFLSHGWTREAGFRRGTWILTAMIVPPAGEAARFADWFRDRHAPEILALPGIESAGLFSLHEAQSLPYPCPFPLAAVYGVSDPKAAFASWQAQEGSATDLAKAAQSVELTFWQPRIARLRAEAVANPTEAAAAEERRARTLYADRFLTQDDLNRLLLSGGAPAGS